jgi:hypothetical protein
MDESQRMGQRPIMRHVVPYVSHCSSLRLPNRVAVLDAFGSAHSGSSGIALDDMILSMHAYVESTMDYTLKGHAPDV